jgi:glycine hydroxymethyltransferase
MSIFNNKLSDDKELDDCINNEFNRQKNGIELIASENFTPKPVLECLGSCLTNKYSEGQIGRRYYGGNKFIDKIESLCKKRALELYCLDKNEWHVNVQPYSGSPANLAVYTGLLKPHDRIMGLDLPSGGHLTHGFYTSKKNISATSIFFESLPYYIGSDDIIDYDNLEKTALSFRPKMIICGASAYPRDIDYKRFREIADKAGCLLMCDMAHISGIVAGHNYHKLFNNLLNPFDYCDIVTTTTHKTLGGPRSGMIFVRNNLEKYGIVNASQQIDDAVFPALQGGPHNHQIAGLAYQLKYAMSDEYKDYIYNVVENAKILSNSLKKYNFEISSDGTDNHIVLVKLKNKGLSGSKMEFLCELCDISINKNSVYGDKNMMNPSGIRLGTSAMTSRGFKQKEFETISEFINDICNNGIKLQKKYGKNLKEFKNCIMEQWGRYTHSNIYGEDNIGLDPEMIQLEQIKIAVNDMASKYNFY